MEVGDATFGRSCGVESGNVGQLVIGVGAMKPCEPMRTQIQFLILGTLGSLMHKLIIFGNTNIVCVSLDNATMCLNSTGKPNVPNLTLFQFLA